MKEPLISIITPAFNQGAFIEDNIRSVQEQGYRNFEHIIVEGTSQDNTAEILRKYPHLRVIRGEDRGYAAAINRGFQEAGGSVLGFLSAEDTLVPGALARVAKEINHKRGIHLIMGRCLFTDDTGQLIGVEHPCRSSNRFQTLAIWRGYWIPQPATFWTPEVWQRCGPLAEDLSGWAEYDLFCRFSLYYRWHFVDQPLATYRLQPQSKILTLEVAKRTEECLPISRRYWGKPFWPFYWLLALSLLQYRWHRLVCGLRLIRGGTEKIRQRRPLAGYLQQIIGASLAPEVAFELAIWPRMTKKLLWLQTVVGRQVLRLKSNNLDSKTLGYMSRLDAWDDDWCGPHLVVKREIDKGATHLKIFGMANTEWLGGELHLQVLVDGKDVGARIIERKGDFSISLALSSGGLAPGEHTIEVKASSWFVVHYILQNGDYRPLAWRLRRIELV